MHDARAFVDGHAAPDTAFECRLGRSYCDVDIGGIATSDACQHRASGGIDDIDGITRYCLYLLAIDMHAEHAALPERVGRVDIHSIFLSYRFSLVGRSNQVFENEVV